MKKFLIITSMVIASIALAIWYVYNYVDFDVYVPLYADHCAQCHGAELEGTQLAGGLLEGSVRFGVTVAELAKRIQSDPAHLGIAGFHEELSAAEFRGLAIYIAERRLGQRFMDFRYDRDMLIPETPVPSEAHRFQVATVIDGLDPLVFSIEPLPDGSILVSEKERGLSLISAAGVQSPVIQGTPETGSSMNIKGLWYGNGWLLDVAAHPDYARNGWIYLHYTHLCGDACDDGLFTASMNRVDRGRIKHGHWVDVETIWQAPFEFYQSTPDTGAGGRLTFDDAGTRVLFCRHQVAARSAGYGPAKSRYALRQDSSSER